MPITITNRASVPTGVRPKSLAFSQVAVTPENVKRVMAKYFKPSNRTVCTLEVQS